MHRILYSVLFILVTCFPSAGTANEADGARELEALRALGYAKTIRATVNSMCTRHGSHILDLCKKIVLIPDRVIEKVALPYFRNHVSAEAASAIVESWSSEEMKTLQRKLIESIAENRVAALTASETKILSEYNRSRAGKAAGKFADDKEAAVAILRKLDAR